MSSNKTNAFSILESRDKRLDGYAYKLTGNQYGMDAVLPNNMEIDENRMSVVVPFASGQRRDGVGDLLEVTGINTNRHRSNPIFLFDHGKQVTLPIALAEDPDTKQYTVEIDAVNKVASAKGFFYQGNGIPNTDRNSEYDHAVFCEQLFDLIAKRFIRAGSIGYQVIKAEQLHPDYQTGTPQGLHLISTLMLECSAVVLPANQDTVIKMLAMPKICGKKLSPYLVKSLSPYVPQKRKAQMGYQKAYQGPDWTPGIRSQEDRVAYPYEDEGSYDVGWGNQENDPKTGGGDFSHALRSNPEIQAQYPDYSRNLAARENRPPEGTPLARHNDTSTENSETPQQRQERYHREEQESREQAEQIAEMRSRTVKGLRTKYKEILPIPHGNLSETDIPPANWKPGVGAHCKGNKDLTSNTKSSQQVVTSKDVHAGDTVSIPSKGVRNKKVSEVEDISEGTRRIHFESTKYTEASESGTRTHRGRGGFASLTPSERSKVARLGGRTAHQMGTAHEFSSQEARRAARASHGEDSRGSGSAGESSHKDPEEGKSTHVDVKSTDKIIVHSRSKSMEVKSIDYNRDILQDKRAVHGIMNRQITDCPNCGGAISSSEDWVDNNQPSENDPVTHYCDNCGDLVTHHRRDYRKDQKTFFNTHHKFIEKRGNEYVVLDHTRKKILGKHPNRSKAVAQLQAIEASKATHSKSLREKYKDINQDEKAIIRTRREPIEGRREGDDPNRPVGHRIVNRYEPQSHESDAIRRVTFHGDDDLISARSEAQQEINSQPPFNDLPRSVHIDETDPDYVDPSDAALHEEIENIRRMGYTPKTKAAPQYNFQVGHRVKYRGQRGQHGPVDNGQSGQIVSAGDGHFHARFGDYTIEVPEDFLEPDFGKSVEVKLLKDTFVSQNRQIYGLIKALTIRVKGQETQKPNPHSEGYRARLASKDKTANPHQDEESRKKWEQGYDTAHQDLRSGKALPINRDSKGYAGEEWRREPGVGRTGNPANDPKTATGDAAIRTRINPDDEELLGDTQDFIDQENRSPEGTPLARPNDTSTENSETPQQRQERYHREEQESREQAEQIAEMRSRTVKGFPKGKVEKTEGLFVRTKGHMHQVKPDDIISFIHPDTDEQVTGPVDFVEHHWRDGKTGEPYGNPSAPNRSRYGLEMHGDSELLINGQHYQGIHPYHPVTIHQMAPDPNIEEKVLIRTTERVHPSHDPDSFSDEPGAANPNISSGTSYQTLTTTEQGDRGGSDRMIGWSSRDTPEEARQEGQHQLTRHTQEFGNNARYIDETDPSFRLDENFTSQNPEMQRHLEESRTRYDNRGKSLDLRQKYRTEDKRSHRVKKSKPGRSMVYVSNKDVDEFRKDVETSKVKADWLETSPQGWNKVRVHGDDETLTRISKRWGKLLPKSKSLNWQRQSGHESSFSANHGNLDYFIDRQHNEDNPNQDHCTLSIGDRYGTEGPLQHCMDTAERHAQESGGTKSLSWNVNEFNEMELKHYNNTYYIIGEGVSTKSLDASGTWCSLFVNNQPIHNGSIKECMKYAENHAYSNN